ncbi:hypothetical protein [Pelomonas cellulosilytica]|uniref:Uncharacterized protein n=1 Tax=Pelomonas cellulosilytica TaxID=2906762 RepID=A0ABS8XVP1_9BURK|nr:hypothetical protein [Pelomonas sp. P8]MCE4554788.1 hypothetical protein [Pelomonas sp. P8]
MTTSTHAVQPDPLCPAGLETDDRTMTARTSGARRASERFGLAPGRSAQLRVARWPAVLHGGRSLVASAALASLKGRC